ncbi:unnamed protein product [Cochlearia groenlandica]
MTETSSKTRLISETLKRIMGQGRNYERSSMVSLDRQTPDRSKLRRQTDKRSGEDLVAWLDWTVWIEPHHQTR